MRSCLLLLLLGLAGCSRGPGLPIVDAARSGDVQTIQRLAAEGANLNERWGVNNWTPLMHAVHKSQAGAVHALLEAGADVNARTSNGMTALLMAAGYGQETIVRDLLKHGADVSLRHADGASALDLAVSGVPDIDRVTVGDCQTGTVKAILEAAPGMRLRPAGPDKAIDWAKLKRCPELASLLK